MLNSLKSLAGSRAIWPGLFVLLTLAWVIMFIVVAAESSKCTVCEVASGDCFSSIWQRSGDAAIRAHFAVSDSHNYGVLSGVVCVSLPLGAGAACAMLLVTLAPAALLTAAYVTWYHQGTQSP
jgi:hypothetical protein